MFCSQHDLKSFIQLYMNLMFIFSDGNPLHTEKSIHNHMWHCCAEHNVIKLAAFFSGMFCNCCNFLNNFLWIPILCFGWPDLLLSQNIILNQKIQCKIYVTDVRTMSSFCLSQARHTLFTSYIKRFHTQWIFEIDTLSLIIDRLIYPIWGCLKNCSLRG